MMIDLRRNIVFKDFFNWLKNNIKWGQSVQYRNKNDWGFYIEISGIGKGDDEYANNYYDIIFYSFNKYKGTPCVIPEFEIYIYDFTDSGNCNYFGNRIELEFKPENGSNNFIHIEYDYNDKIPDLYINHESLEEMIYMIMNINEKTLDNGFTKNIIDEIEVDIIMRKKENNEEEK